MSLAGPQVLQGCLPYSCNGLRAFPQFPEVEILLNKGEGETETETERDREREREVWPERSILARLWWGVLLGEQTPSECWMVMVTS
jgi:hypothetical protein